MLGSLMPHASAILLILQRVVELVWIIAALLLMLKANSGERYRVALRRRSQIVRRESSHEAKSWCYVAIGQEAVRSGTHLGRFLRGDRAKAFGAEY